ncbi:MAG: YgdI/YgdR family lipoprotein [Pantoea sp.]|uniref:YgdI/YgdR family lipoprotein n=2 Tax=Pantoea septica TaxID=472695 RepID=UPI000E9F224B|nr:YgdI/YgdR family lipoprotein [Pantoea septica]MBU5377482.1 YgdI/YgdR family lipoprotein [Pantoea septica]MDU5835489.1 YgdI/YgdR family lipoprotein [Pantoea sp.]MDU6438445.1 YgdI/YgdR family lipoprotein [Pantoea sp.]HAT24666.1 YgdI/YgdR family lipoprotein [Pantoea septica]
MKKTVMAIGILSAGLMLAGCANDHVLHTNDGRTIVAQGKPQVDDDTGMITYKDVYGKEQQINRDSIKDMSQVGN